MEPSHLPAQNRSDRPALLLRGSDLRYCLLTLLHDRGPARIAELRAQLEQDGLRVRGGDPNKVISDALRHECSKGRVARVARGTYRALHRPERTVRRHRARRRSLVDEARRLRTSRTGSGDVG